MHTQKIQRIPSHSLIFLGKELQAPQSIMAGIRQLTPQYTVSRYPDVADDVPFELFDQDIALNFYGIATKTIAWIKPQLS